MGEHFNETGVSVNGFTFNTELRWTIDVQRKRDAADIVSLLFGHKPTVDSDARVRQTSNLVPRFLQQQHSTARFRKVVDYEFC